MHTDTSANTQASIPDPTSPGHGAEDFPDEKEPAPSSPGGITPGKYPQRRRYTGGGDRIEEDNDDGGDGGDGGGDGGD